MKSAPFVKREAELRKSLDVLQRARRATGGMVLLERTAGSGKSVFLAERYRWAAADPGLKDATFVF